MAVAHAAPAMPRPRPCMPVKEVRKGMSSNMSIGSSIMFRMADAVSSFIGVFASPVQRNIVFTLYEEKKIGMKNTLM